MLNNIMLGCINIFELYIIYRFMHIFFEGIYDEKILIILGYLFRYIIGTYMAISSSYPIVNLILSFVTLFCITIFYHSKIIKKIMVTFIVQISMLLAEALVAVLLSRSDFSKLDKVEYINFYSVIMVQIILWSITIILGKFKNLQQETYVPKRLIFAMISVSIFSFYMELLVFEQKNIRESILFSSLICVLILNFIMIYLYDTLSATYIGKMKIEFIEREKEYYHEQSELLQKTHNDLKTFRHDEKNRLLVLRQLIENDKKEKAMEYLSKINEKLCHKEIFSSTGNIALDSILNYKLSFAHENGIEVCTDIFIPKDIPIEDDDIVIIFSNLLDNAIEASARLKEKRYIEVRVKYEKNYLQLRISNRFDFILKQVDGKMITRKENSSIHGIGISSVQSVVNKYEGLIELKQEEDMFIVNALLYV